MQAARVGYRATGAGRRRSAFTLIELLVAMGVIIVLATVTLVSVRALAQGASRASAVNRVKAMLGSARATAMKRGRPVAVVFTASWDPARPDVPQRTEMWLVEYSGVTLQPDPLGNPNLLIDRFVPVEDAEPLALPAGFKVAGPWYDLNTDGRWVTQPELRLSDPVAFGSPEWPGRMIAVMFAPDGSLVTSRPMGDNSHSFVDFNHGVTNTSTNVNGDGDDDGSPQDLWDTSNTTFPFFDYNEPGDETNLVFVPFLAVYNDDEAREFYGADDWSDEEQYFAELVNGVFNNTLNPNVGYITEYGERIHFNRYTGVVMR